MWNKIFKMNSNEEAEKNNFHDLIWKVIITASWPIILYVLYSNDVILLQTFRLLLALILFFHIILPFIFIFSYAFQRNVIFLNSANFPRFAHFHCPEHHGLNGARNLYLKQEDGVELGIWHILPEKLIKQNLPKEDEEEYFEKSLNYGIPVVVYVHGNSSNRAAAHHIELHKILRKNYHVITFDYRGYGDSTGVPLTEDMVVNDSIAILKWVQQLSTAPILVWSHSLGTAVALNSLKKLTEENNCFVKGLVLETPFDNMRNEVAEHPMTWIFKNLPWFQYAVVDTIYKSGFKFSSDEYIKHVNIPILFLHAEDDWIVPFHLGWRLYSVALKSRKPHQGSIQFEKFSKRGGHGHKHICRSPALPNIIKNFYDQCLQK